MKKLISVFLLVFAYKNFAIANAVLLEKGDKALVPIEGTWVLDEEPMQCPPGMACPALQQNVLKFTYTLHGCLDRLASFYTVKAKVDQETFSASYEVLVTAFNVSTQASENVKCAAPPFAFETVVLGAGVVSDVSVVYVNDRSQ